MGDFLLPGGRIKGSKGNQTIKFGQVIEYNRKIFLQKIMQKMRQGD